MNYLDQLMAEPDAFRTDQAIQDLFFHTMQELTTYHRSANQVYDNLCRLHNFSFDQINSPDELWKIPHLIVTALKEQVLLSVPQEQIVSHMTSSGTSGQQSQLFWDAASRDRQALMRQRIIETYGLADPDNEVNYLIFSYDPQTSGEKGAAHTHQVYASFAPAREKVFAITQGTDGEPEFQVEACIDALDRFAESGLPLRVTGFPSFSYMTLQKLKELGKKYTFPKESLLFSGGGWKLHSGKAVSYEEYVDLVQEILGIDRSRIRDVYGMVEHGVPYITCEHGAFHVPIYAKVWALDPANSAVLPKGEVGLLKLISPYITSMPSISVLATDWGAVTSGCPCGREGDILHLHGRAGIKKYQGCAISAAQLLGHS